MWRAFLRSAAFVLLASGTVLGVSQQPAQTPATPPPPAGLLMGTISDAVSGRPVPGATVMLSLQPVPGSAGGDPFAAPATLSQFPARVLADGSGRFVFLSLPAGTFLLSVTKPGYTDGAFGRTSPGDTQLQPIVLASGQQRGDINARLWKFGSISGTVVDEAGEPMVAVSIRVMRRAISGGRSRLQIFGGLSRTDDRGMYRVSAVPPGDYVVGIITTQATVPTGVPTPANAGFAEFSREIERSGGLMSINLAIGVGQPVGDWQLLTQSQGPISPGVRDGKVMVYPTTFYPATNVPAKATPISIAAGEDRNGIDFQLSPVVTANLSGRVTGPNGPERPTVVELIPGGTDEIQRDSDVTTATSITDTTGAFVLLGVPAGNYTLRVLKLPPRPTQQNTTMTLIQTGSTTIGVSTGLGPQPPVPDTPTFWASLPVTVNDANITGLSLVLQPGARISGRLVFTGAAEPPAGDRLKTISITIDPADGRTTTSNQFTMGRGSVDENRQFKSYQLPPGRYVVRGGLAPAGWTFLRATVEGRDVSDAPIDLGAEDLTDVVVTFTDKPSELTGAIRNTKGVDAAATVLVFPAAQDMWSNYGTAPRRLRSIRTATDGTFRSPGIPPGDYLVVATDGSVPVQWMDAAFLKSAAQSATRVTIGDGEKKTVELDAKVIR